MSFYSRSLQIMKALFHIILKKKQKIKCGTIFDMFPKCLVNQDHQREIKRLAVVKISTLAASLPSLNTVERDESSWALQSCHVSLTASSQFSSPSDKV